MLRDLSQLTVIGLVAATLSACGGSSQPVIYPNAHAQSVGQSQVENDIAQCRTMAQQAGAKPYGGQADDAARAAVRGGALGSATGAVGGAIGGDPLRGATIGAATGATASVLHRMFSEPAPNPAYRTFVERCLRDRGYDLAGWN